MMTNEEFVEKLTALFIEFGAAPEGYDIELWTRKDHENAVAKHAWDQTFEDVCRKAAENLAEL